MAQQNLDFNIVAHTKGMEQIASLINRVGALEAEINKVKTANAGLAASSDAVIRNGVRYNNAIDAQSKALKNARQGTQQLGMQINDFATSVSTGASPIQAFNQQIGQVGYAMSMMGGTAGRVGAFLAGPWGAAVTMATMALGMLWDNFNGAEESARDFRDVMVDQKASLEEVIAAVDEYNAEIDRQRQDVLALLNLQKNSVRARLNEAMSIWQEVIALRARNSALRESPQYRAQTAMGGIIATQMYAAEVVNAEAQVGKLTRALSNLDWETNEELTRRAEKANRDNSRATDEQREKTTQAERAARVLFDTYNAGLITMQDFIRGGEEVAAMQREQDLATMDQVQYITRLINLIDQAAPAYANLREEMRRQNAGLENLRTIGDVVPEDMVTRAKEQGEQTRDIIRGYTDDMKASFDAVGQSVNDAFKGMITGAMGWKDAMRGIINSVIDQLWKMYVTQQIVGLITGGLKAIGMPMPAPKAIGGAVSAKTPYMVGERGPELFIPGGNGTIIPNKNMLSGNGASTFNISVDARGSSDPAAVREQVQRGIIEAAPAIIAAAERRTVSGLQRPRLGGVIQ